MTDWPTEDNWDGYGATRTTAEAVNAFRHFVATAIPEVDGGILFDNDLRDDLFIHITPDGDLVAQNGDDVDLLADREALEARIEAATELTKVLMVSWMTVGVGIGYRDLWNVRSALTGEQPPTDQERLDARIAALNGDT